jgi:thiol:disulfide interchange protein/DsbC/DsbD-like thiol-disulfide interchange protein
MFLVRRLLSAVAFLTLALLSPVSAAAAMPSHVQASLVAADATIQPGKTFTVALRFVHDPHWHTYWLNPGTGLPTTLTWTLPPGFTAGEIQWPAPSVLKDRTGTVIGNGYEGELFLPVTLTAPADLQPGATIELKALADWLMCEEVCMPGKADLRLSLAVAADAPRPEAKWSEKVRATLAALPRSDAAWEIIATRDAKTVTLSVTPTAAGGQKPRSLHFFSADGLVAYEQQQRVTDNGKGGFTLALPIAADGPKDATKLVGVLTSENGWRPDGMLRGLQVDATLGKSPEGVSAGTATATAGGATSSSTNGAMPKAAIGFATTLALAFLGGLILNLMPCVFPVLGIKILGFVNQSANDRGKVAMHGVVFTLGVLVSFWALVALLLGLHTAGENLGWGYQLQEPRFVFVIAAVMLVMAMNLSGVFEFGLRATGVGSSLQTKTGLAGSFFTGVLATVVATPCSGPFLGTALGASLTLNTQETFALFTSIALGLSTPYLLLSIFPQAVKALPRPGAWMETFKQFMAFPLYATVGYLVWVLVAQTSEEGLRNALFGLVLVAMAVWVYGRCNAPGASAGRTRFGVAGLIALALAGTWLGWPRSLEAKPSVAGSMSAPEIVWEPWSPEAVEKLRAEGRIVYVDFTARWCATCQTNKLAVFHSDEVLKFFAEKKIATLRADWTNKNPQIAAELAKYGRRAVPFNVIWFPGKSEPVILPEVLTPNTVLEALRGT